MKKSVKKFLSVFLSVLIFVMMLITVRAYDEYTEIKMDETLTVTTEIVDGINSIVLKFIPEESGFYALSSSAGGIDVYCDLTDEDFENYLTSADDENNWDFVLEYDFQAGVTYYFIVGAFSENSETFEVTLGCAHSYSDGICTVCGEACTHSDMVFLGLCACGEKFLGKEIKADGASLVCDAAENDNCGTWVRFIPSESGVYYLDAASAEGAESDSYCDLYDENGEWLSFNDDFLYGEDAEDYDFCFYYTFEAGKVYYFLVSDYTEDAVCSVKLEKAIHTDEDGSVHNTELIDAVFATCTSDGYSEGLYCSECDIFLWGHITDEKYPHYDDDFDGFCDECGIEVEADYGGNFFTDILNKIKAFFIEIWFFLTALFS